MGNIKNKINIFLSGNIKYTLIFLVIMGVGIINLVNENKDVGSFALSDEVLMDAGVGEVFNARSMLASVPMQKAILAESSRTLSDVIPAGKVSNRKIQETINISISGPNNDVRSVYTNINELCLVGVCEIGQSDLYTGGSQFSANIRLKLDHSFVEQFFKKTDSVYNDYDFNITNKSRSSQDRTAQFSDVAARRNAQVVLRDRLNKLVESYQGRDIKSLLEIERELARVQGQIESMDAQLRNISSVTDRVTVNISIEGKIEYKPTQSQSSIMKALNEAHDIIEANIAKIIRIVSAMLPWFVISIFIIGIWKFIRRFIS